MLKISDSIAVPLDAFTFTFTRSRGPGGQNVNKVHSRATLSWRPEPNDRLPSDVLERLQGLFPTRFTKDGVLKISSERFRDQGRNVADCLEKLRELLQQAAKRPKVRRKTRRSRASQERRLSDKRQVATRKRERRGPSGQ
ncbi:MAG: aminoacyl-tRNA hydrolase [Planctomycetes bacterium]|nr:aminoacyl-tRNA hydrolase [Planctomycetota bacterium]